ncbi:MAG: hypothetical protein K8T91_22240 [Planctomycetes bacterium]|nr:hypothetical protein [Planctomycetota bacterium]
MAILLELFLLCLLVVVPAVFLVLGIVALLVGWATRKKWLKVVGAIVAGIPGTWFIAVSVFALCVIFSAGPTKDERGRRLVALPPEATVVSVEEGNWAGDGIVVFHLPNNRTPSEWMDDIWDNTARGFPANISKTDQRREGSQGEDRRELHYDPETDLYTYKVQLAV